MTSHTRTEERCAWLLELREYAIVFGVLAILAYLFYRLASPSDWVEVKAGPLPAGSGTFVLVAEDDDGIAALPWYRWSYGPSATDPSEEKAYWNSALHDSVTVSVRWKLARRYGIAFRREDEPWRIGWVEPGGRRGPSFWRFLVGGGGSEWRLPAEDRSEAASELALKRLGLVR